MCNSFSAHLLPRVTSRPRRSKRNLPGRYPPDHWHADDSDLSPLDSPCLTAIRANVRRNVAVSAASCRDWQKLTALRTRPKSTTRSSQPEARVPRDVVTWTAFDSAAGGGNLAGPWRRWRNRWRHSPGTDVPSARSYTTSSNSLSGLLGRLGSIVPQHFSCVFLSLVVPASFFSPCSLITEV